MNCTRSTLPPSLDHNVETINVDRESMQMEIGTGASLSLVSEQEFRDTWPEREVSTTDITLHSYSGESIPIVGTVDVCVKCNRQDAVLPLVVIIGVGPSLLGRNWLN